MKLKFLLIAFPLLIFSCGDSGLTSQDLLPDASGEHGHILVLMDNNLWDGNLGNSVKAQLDQRAPGIYLRPEPMFDYYHKTSESLTHVNKMGRLILKVFIDRDSTYSETALIEKRDYWAKGQLFLVVKDSDPNRLMEYVQNDFGSVLQKMNDFEANELIRHYKERTNNAVKEQAELTFGISISLPREAELKVKEDNFMWVKYDRSRRLMGNEANSVDGGTFWVQEGLIFWSEPYSEEAMDPYHILEKRDTILKYNIPGKVSGSYMATEYDSCCAPQGWVTTYHENDCVIFRGLWIHAGRIGAAGGGPFVQYSIHNPTNNTVVTVCGYVYAPKFDKREHIREIEAMLNTIEIN